MIQKEILDAESEALISILAEQERVRQNRVAGVRTVLVVLSAKGVVLDVEALRQKILMAYPDAAVFFRTTAGSPVGVSAPDRVDLLIDLTGPGQRQNPFYARKLRRLSRITVGRNAGLFRKRIYDRVFDEKARAAELPADLLHRERVIQRAVLELAGISSAPMGDALTDRSKSIALELPSMQRL